MDAAGTAGARNAKRPRRNRSAAARLRDTLLSLLSLALVVLAWHVWSSSSGLLPTISEVADAAEDFYTNPAIYQNIGATFLRVVISVAIGLVLGLIGAILSRRGGLVGQIVDVYVSLAIAIPSTVAALLALFIFHRSEVGVYAVVVLVIWPFMVLTLRGGLQLMDPKLDGMADVYNFSYARRLRKVVVPQLTPYAFAAMRSENAHAWRVVVLAEVFAVNSGMGAQFTKAYDRFLIDEVVLWILTFIVILLFVEYLVLRPLENHFMRWRFQDVR
ncbi:ABC transporter permease [Mycolicibacterium parafortuitum]|uniref:Nitrate/sulfonate/bicarbonate ABC transporter permease [Pelagibacterium halotolerans B2] n=1 Tax=Mycolicibacterium parafortuitum TaxID=39692 RepID=A0A375YLS9_MYCPF|nr:ABC transporter permease subunit [Mycolicibacterium parafortuitum]SRX82096.1 nitrate/sulfonate/bicarbonate ABC transporter permease [Pelagibacterium halotolerans B2] [Mycolicibacterium parafortuitum]